MICFIMFAFCTILIIEFEPMTVRVTRPCVHIDTCDSRHFFLIFNPLEWAMVWFVSFGTNFLWCQNFFFPIDDLTRLAIISILIFNHIDIIPIALNHDYHVLTIDNFCHKVKVAKSFLNSFPDEFHVILCFGL